ncbi:hypothetical protein BB560_000768 [Smittium megazygosporum]|uniref:RRM domain-containing protein n=1 Tax=Smittium megazygosporum TaxID=133381 RepID=A0A2T9ZJJ1_9FUNG|nr:hypothetical protein BB560_000768 [Smittium megazygosporum]
MRDQASSRPRGFGFVTFADESSIAKVLQEPSHFIDDKKIDPKPAVPRDQQSMNSHSFNQGMNQQFMSGNFNNQSYQTHEQRSDTLFAGGLPQTATEKDLHEAFEQFGNILEVKMMTDRETGRPRGFAFIKFESETSVQKAIKDFEVGNGLIIHDKKIDVKNAVHKKKTPHNDGMMSGGSMGANQSYGYASSGMNGI